MKNSTRKLAPMLSLMAFVAAVDVAAAADERAGAQASTAGSASHQSSPPYVAVVNGQVISSAEYETTANEAARQKFYHGKPPEGAAEQLQRDVADKMINRVLLLEEAARRGLKADKKAVDEKLSRYEQRYSTSARWQQERDKLVSSLRERLEQDNVLAALEDKVRQVPPPSEEKVRAYYKANSDKFTEPEKMRISMILLEVDPSSPTAAWQAAEEEAAGLLKRIRAGADFAETARKHSKDDSAANGGDLGYLHRGMLPDGIQDKIDAMKPGDLSVPTRILQGYAIFRYDALQPPKHHAFATVRQRASDLLARDQSDQAWTDFLAGLRKKAKIELNTQRYPALAAGAR